MNIFRLVRICFSFSILSVAPLILTGRAQTGPGPENPEVQSMVPVHDGQHDFDFLYGRWKVHCRRLLHPLTGSNEWIEFDGTNVVHRVWDGRANMDEFEADTPSGHIERMTIRTYNEKSHQWPNRVCPEKSGRRTKEKAREMKAIRKAFHVQPNFDLAIPLIPC